MLVAKTTYTNKRKKKVMIASESNKGHAKLHTPRTGPIGCRWEQKNKSIILEATLV